MSVLFNRRSASVCHVRAGGRKGVSDEPATRFGRPLNWEE